MAKVKDESEAAGIAKKRKRDKGEDGRHSLHKKHRSNGARDPADRDDAQERLGRQTNGALVLANGEKEDNANATLAEATHVAVVNGTGGQSAASAQPLWRVSEPMGGRMLDIDPIFSPDEQYLILTYDTSIQVYSTADSLLIRRIAVPVFAEDDNSHKRRPNIIASLLSQSASDLIWVATSDGRVWRMNWTTGAGSGPDECFHVGSSHLVDVSLASIQFGEEQQDVVVTSEKLGKHSRQLIAYDLESLKKGKGATLYTDKRSVPIVKCASSGKIITCATKDGILIGALQHSERPVGSLNDLTYAFYSFELEDRVTCLDVRVSQGSKNRRKIPVVDLAIGGARGKILVYQDVLMGLRSREGQSLGQEQQTLQHRLYHWHRRAVHTLKWTSDGGYLISGGSEQVLVQWQLDTGKKDFLPHLSADIENVAISPQGASYAVHMGNNSAMVLSTADMKPTTYVAGLQSFTERTTSAKDFLVHRVDQVVQPTPSALIAAINPVQSSHIFLCCGSGQHTSGITTPWVQTFDLDTFRSVSKQAIARSNPTEPNINSQGQLGSEPTVRHMSFSSDGRWLVTVDEWQPPTRDYDSIADKEISIRDLVSDRREVFLKFWSVDAESGSLSLVSRVNQPHLAEKPQPVLGLASDPSSTRFATLGADGLVRIWDSRQKITTASGRDEKAYVSSTWTCSQDIYIEPNPESLEVSIPAPFYVEPTRQGALTFSEDGSTLFTAMSGDGVAEVHIIDTRSGNVRSVLPDVFSGELKALEIMGSTLIVLADELTVYDVVADELIYGVHLQKLSSQWAPLTQIAVDRRSDTFVVSMPRLAKRESPSSEVLHGSEIAFFSPQRPEPLLVQHFPRVLTGLLQSGRGQGFIAIDAAAQIWSIQHASDPSSLARPLAELGLNGAAVEQTDVAQVPLPLTNGEDAMSVEDEAETMESVQEEEEEPGAHAAVIAPQRLTEIFDAGPAFALPPVEEMFYQVTKLLIA